MALLITIVIDDPAQVPIFSTCWLVTTTIILSRGLSCVNPSGRGGAPRPGAVRAAIATISIVHTLPVISAQSLWGLSLHGTMRMHGLCLLRAEQKKASISGVILGRFWGRAVAPRIANIHLTDLERKVQGGFGLNRDNLLNSQVPGVVLITFLLCLGTDGGL